MNKQNDNLLEFAQNLLQREDIAALALAFERALYAECQSDAELVAALTMNFASFTLCLAKTPTELATTTQLLGQVIEQVVNRRYIQITGLYSATVH